MTCKLGRIAVWLRRIGHCRGFGVQSPWAYSLVRYVINEHSPYYAYKRLERKYPAKDAVRLKKARFMLRLANYVQPRTVVCIAMEESDTTLIRTYSHAGCRKRKFFNFSSVAEFAEQPGSNSSQEHPLIMCVSADCSGLEDALGALRSGDYMLIDGIYASRKAKKTWRKVAAQMPGVVTFDMYYCGIACFDEKRYKQNYIINF